MLEEMAAFFEARLDSYDDHMMRNITGAEEFYPFTARQLPQNPGTKVLDLGCGTGLELEYYFGMVPTAQITGIDISAGMLEALKEKFPRKELNLICGSYFDVPFGVEQFDAAVSVESLHHFTRGEKVPLYTKLLHALKPQGYFVLTDYFAVSEEEEQRFRQDLAAFHRENGVLYHFDTPLTVEHEKETLLEAGFASVRALRQWGATTTLLAEK